jgi:hypothetical protein
MTPTILTLKTSPSSIKTNHPPFYDVSVGNKLMKIKIIQVIEQLELKGSVSRNWALSKRISRLGAHINELIKLGWKFDDYKSKNGKETMRGRYVMSNYGIDYVYYLVSKPKKIKRI